MTNAIPAGKPGPKHRALVVEDDMLVRMAIVDMLETAGHSAEEVPDAEAALIRLESDGRFDVLISDISLPGLSGEELALAVRGRWPAIRIVLVSGRDRAALSNASGPFLFLPKPFQFEELLKAVEG
jgi:CheY-like chemotaxis protein